MICPEGLGLASKAMGRLKTLGFDYSVIRHFMEVIETNICGHVIFRVIKNRCPICDDEMIDVMYGEVCLNNECKSNIKYECNGSSKGIVG